MATNTKTDQKQNKRKSSTTSEWFETLDPNNMMSNAQKVLSSAVNVLEEEIAAGIIAAKKIEKKIIDVEEIREDPKDLMNRIRRDIHEAVDILMDSVTALSRQLGVLSGNIINKNEAAENTVRPSAPAVKEKPVTVIAPINKTKPGETARLIVSLSNDNVAQIVNIAFQKSDLSGSDGQRISAKNIILKPLQVKLKPGEEKEIIVLVQVPNTCRPGQYSGLFVDANDAANKVILQIDVS